MGHSLASSQIYQWTHKMKTDEPVTDGTAALLDDMVQFQKRVRVGDTVDPKLWGLLTNHICSLRH